MFWAMMPPWVGWLAGAAMWALFGLLTIGMPVSWFLFVMAFVYGIITLFAYVRRKKRT